MSERRRFEAFEPRTVRLVLHQARYDLLSFLRNRQSRFFTLILPVLFLVIFVSVFGNHRVGPQHVKAATFYVPGIAALGIIGASFVNLVISVTTQREAGVLKRRRSTPVPASVLIAGRALTAIAVSLAVMTVLLLIGRFGYDVRISPGTLPGVVLTAVVGAISFCCVGYAFTTAIHNADAAQPMVQAVILPALLHLRRLHPQRQPSHLATRRRQGLSCPASRERPPPRLRPGDDGKRHRLERPRRPRTLGHSGPRRRTHPVQLDTSCRHRLTNLFRPRRRIKLSSAGPLGQRSERSWQTKYRPTRELPDARHSRRNQGHPPGRVPVPDQRHPPLPRPAAALPLPNLRHARDDQLTPPPTIRDARQASCTHHR